MHCGQCCASCSMITVVIGIICFGLGAPLWYFLYVEPQTNFGSASDNTQLTFLLGNNGLELFSLDPPVGDTISATRNYWGKTCKCSGSDDCTCEKQSCKDLKDGADNSNSDFAKWHYKGMCEFGPASFFFMLIALLVALVGAVMHTMIACTPNPRFSGKMAGIVSFACAGIMMLSLVIWGGWMAQFKKDWLLQAFPAIELKYLAIPGPGWILMIGLGFPLSIVAGILGLVIRPPGGDNVPLGVYAGRPAL
mmetsp:Transcript_39811/g.86203  ORF Transcript_39811/g.86203 Transcript_39811/m.86203 type:complete len:250 (+) Transcript_39811:46-795(+)